MAAPPGPEDIEGEPREPPDWVRYLAGIITVIILLTVIFIVLVNVT